jgi:hypothetical protein
MKQHAAYTIVEDGEEKFFTVLDCGCELHVAVDQLFEDDLPCPLHEENRYLYDFNDGKKPREN